MNGPLHRAATDRLRRAIMSGAYREGDRLPSEPALAREMGVSRATLREALTELECEGMVRRLHGIGTFVRSQRPAASLSLSVPRSITAMIESLGLNPGTRDMRVVTEPVFPDDMEKLGVRPGSTVFRIERVRTANGQPVAYTIDVVPSWVMKRYPTWEPGANFSLVSHLSHYCGVAFEHLTATLMPLHNIATVAEKLELDSFTHIFFFEEVDRNTDGLPVLSSREYFAPWIFRFIVRREV